MSRSRRFDPQPAPRSVPNEAPGFFVPACDEAQAEEIWRATIQFMRSSGFAVLEERIFCLTYVHDGKEVVDVVGERDRCGQEPVLVLLRTPTPGPSLVCTANRGVLRGHPIVAPGDAGVIPFAGTTLRSRGDR